MHTAPASAIESHTLREALQKDTDIEAMLLGARARVGAHIPLHAVDAEGCVALVNLVTNVQRRTDRGSTDRGVTAPQLIAVSGGIDSVARVERPTGWGRTTDLYSDYKRDISSPLRSGSSSMVGIDCTKKLLMRSQILLFRDHGCV
jgi:hypothetical protein